MKRTPESFRFCPKLSRYITHQLRLLHVEEPLKKFFDVFEGMKMRMGPVLIQLPPGLSYDEPMISDFFNLLQELTSDIRYAIEIRHKSWITDNFFSLLNRCRIAFVIADSGKRFPHYDAVTTDLVYMRFHGHEKLYASDYSEEELSQYAGKIIKWLHEGKEVWAFFNNDFGGFAVKNAMQLRGMVFK